MQPKLPNSSATQDATVYSLEVIGGKNCRKLQIEALKIGLVLSVGTVIGLFGGQNNPALGIESIEINSVEDNTSGDFSESKGEQIANAILQEKLNKQKLVSGVDNSQTTLITSSKQPLIVDVDNKQSKELTIKLQAQQKAAMGDLQKKSNRLRSSLAQFRNEGNKALLADENYHQTLPSQTNINSHISYNPDYVKVKVKEYEVKPGDTLAAIALRHGISIAEIIQANRLINPNQLRISQRLDIPEKNNIRAIAQEVVPSPQYQRGTVVSPHLPHLPPLAAPGQYLPKPINENTAPPILPGSTNTAFIWPAKGVLTSGYGMRWGRMHRGIDIANKIGTPIYAAATGVVEFEGKKRGYGNLVDIRHLDGSLTRYAHNHKHFIDVGKKVQQGEIIAHMGNTGFSTGPHLHFEIHPSGKRAENPIAYLPPRV